MSLRNRYNPKYLAACWKLGDASEVLNKYPGTLTNAPTFGVGPKGTQCIEFGGTDQRVNIGDVLELNSVPAFTITYWMNQDILDVQDRILFRFVSGTNNLMSYTAVNGFFYHHISNGINSYGIFNYSNVIAANSWHHIAWVFDGSQATNATRMLVYVDGAPVGLNFTGTIPATTGDLAGDKLIGHTTEAFDGKLWDFRIHSVPLSRDEILGIQNEVVPIF